MFYRKIGFFFFFYEIHLTCVTKNIVIVNKSCFNYHSIFQWKFTNNQGKKGGRNWDSTTGSPAFQTGALTNF